MEAQLAQRESFPARVSAIDAMEMFLRTKRSEVTRLAYQRDLNQFFRFHTGQPPTPETVAKFIGLDTAGVVRAMLSFKIEQLERGVAEVTLNRRLSAVRSLLQVARQLGLTDVNPQGLVQGERVQQYRDTRGVPKETAALMLSLPDTTTVKGKRDAAILRLLWELALRRWEVCKLKRTEFDPDAKTLSVHGKGKGTQAVLMTLSDRCVAAIQDYLRARDDDQPELFLSCNRFKDGHLEGLKGYSMAFIVKHYARLAGVKRFSPHRWRRARRTEAEPAQ